MPAREIEEAKETDLVNKSLNDRPQEDEMKRREQEFEMKKQNLKDIVDEQQQPKEEQQQPKEELKNNWILCEMSITITICSY